MKMKIRNILIALFFLPLLFNVVFLSEAKEEKTNETLNNISELLSRLGQKASAFKTLKTDFVQEKELAMFKNKITIKGRIYIQKPDKLAWHVDKPVRYSVLITDKSIRQWDEETDRVQELSLSANPVFQNVVNQMTVWFSGDYSSLIGDNDVRLIKNSPIMIDFIPKESNMAKKIIRSITITFREDEKYVERIRIQEKSGDVTTIIFLNTVLNAPLDSSSFEVKGNG